MQANRQIQNYQAFVLFKKRKTARASGLIRRTPAFFSAIFLVRLLHAPISRAVRRKTAAAAEIVRPSGDKVHRPPRARVKVRVERFALRVHGHQHALALRRALEDVLPVRQQHRAVSAMAQCPAAPARRRQPGNILRQPVFLRHVHRGAQRRVAVLFAALHAPLAAVINAGHAGHAEQYPVQRPQMLFVR